MHREFYRKPYAVMGLAPAEQQELAPALFMDAAPVHGVERPNHGLGNAIRKAQLVPLVASAYVELSPRHLRVPVIVCPPESPRGCVCGGGRGTMMHAFAT